MAISLKISSIGNSLGVILPKELLTKLRVGKGDHLIVTETPDGVELRVHTDTFAEQMNLAEYVMHKHRDVLKKLAE